MLERPPTDLVRVPGNIVDVVKHQLYGGLHHAAAQNYWSQVVKELVVDGGHPGVPSAQSVWSSKVQPAMDPRAVDIGHAERRKVRVWAVVEHWPFVYEHLTMCLMGSGMDTFLYAHPTAALPGALGLYAKYIGHLVS